MEELGYRPAGFAEGGKLVLTHPTARPVTLKASPSDQRYVKNVLALARQNIKDRERAVTRFIGYLCQLYEVPETGSADVRLRLSEEVANFIQRQPDKADLNADSIQQLARKADRLQLIQAGNRGSDSTWRIFGRNFEAADLTPITDDLEPDTTPVKIDVSDREEAAEAPAVVAQSQPDSGELAPVGAVPLPDLLNSLRSHLMPEAEKQLAERDAALSLIVEEVNLLAQEVKVVRLGMAASQDRLDAAMKRLHDALSLVMEQYGPAPGTPDTSAASATQSTPHTPAHTTESLAGQSPHSAG